MKHRKIESQKKVWKFMRLMGKKKDKNRKAKMRYPPSPPPGTLRPLPVIYNINGDPDDSVPYTFKLVQKIARFAMRIYNRTHLDDYEFVEPLYAIARGFAGYMVTLFFTAKPLEPPADGLVHEYPIIFQTDVNLVHHYVDYVRLIPPADLPLYHEFLTKEMIELAASNCESGARD
ncbi:hypothetical protein ABFS82_06G058400 [Erythranthe guttata]